MSTTRPKLLFVGSALMTVMATVLADAPVRGGVSPLVLENDRVLLQMDPASGTIGRILDKSSGIELAPPPALAENFRLVLLLPDKKTATILGKDQKLSSVNRTDAGLALNWNGPLKDKAGKERAIAVRMEVTLGGNELQFRLHLTTTRPARFGTLATR